MERGFGDLNEQFRVCALPKVLDRKLVMPSWTLHGRLLPQAGDVTKREGDLIFRRVEACDATILLRTY